MTISALKLALISFVLLAATLSNAQSAMGTINANFINLGTNTIALYFTDGSVALSGSGSGSNTPTLYFGQVSRLGTLPAGVSRSITASDYTISASVNVVVDSTGLTNSRVPNGYTLSASLQSNPANFSVRINNIPAALTTATTVLNPAPQAAFAYDVAQPQTIKLTIPNSSTFGSQLNTVVNFTATAR